tara:strand:- start:373 stop:612 length:240 start_codon:yes stop_codon:yes gene_type:complete
VDLNKVHTIRASLFEINVKRMAVSTEFLKEIILMKKIKQKEEDQELKEKVEYEEDGLDYEDLYYDDSSEVDYGLEYTTT